MIPAMKIVVLDGYVENPGDLSWDGLAALGELTVYDRTSLTDEAEIIARIGDAEIVFTNKTAANGAAFNFRITVERGTSAGGYISGVSGAFQ